MKSVKKGDKVKFLNDVGGGVVTRVIGNTVYVEDEDGFEIPALMNNIVLIETEKVIDTVSHEKKKKEYKYNEIEGGDDELNCYLAILKGRSKDDNSGDYRLFFVNDSNYFCFYTISVLSINEVNPLYNGLIEPNTKEQLDVIPIQHFDNKTLLVQLVLYKSNKRYKYIKPVERQIPFKSNQLLRTGSLSVNDYFDENAKLYQLIKRDIDLKIDQLIESKKDISSKLYTTIKKTTHVKNDDLIEVDLHIHELLDDIRGLSNAEMLKIQIDKFKEVLKQNEKNKKQKIVFIHGVGNGTLKQEIHKLLKSQYKHLYFQDASFQEYGYGATMVII
ncbi:MAG: DUF2027 domain-containing protein [Bacteroidales bacterium]|nr:DUF2027 domain-containing protein [Bacteroidales bacterium]